MQIKSKTSLLEPLLNVNNVDFVLVGRFWSLWKVCHPKRPQNGFEIRTRFFLSLLFTHAATSQMKGRFLEL